MKGAISSGPTCATTSLSKRSWYCHMKSACSNSTFLRMDMSGSMRIHRSGESALPKEWEVSKTLSKGLQNH